MCFYHSATFGIIRYICNYCTYYDRYTYALFCTYREIVNTFPVGRGTLKLSMNDLLNGPAEQLWNAVLLYLKDKRLTEAQLSELGTITRINHDFWAKNYPEVANCAKPVDDKCWAHFMNWLPISRKSQHDVLNAAGVIDLVKPAKVTSSARRASQNPDSAPDKSRAKSIAKNMYVCDGTYYRQLPSGNYKAYNRHEFLLYLQEEEACEYIEGYDESKAVMSYIKEHNELDSVIKELFTKPGLLPKERTLYNILNVSKHVVMKPTTSGKHEPVLKYLRELFVTEDQLNSFLTYWRKVYMDRYSMMARYTQACVVCGEPESGKSLLATLMSASLGGGAFSAKRMVEGGTFNGPELRSPMLVLDDAFIEEKNLHKYQMFINEMVVEPEKRSENKNADAVMVRAFLPILILCNYTKNGLTAVPKYDRNMAGKCLYYRVGKPKMSNDTDKELMASLPSFLRWLMDWTPPKSCIADTRFGVAPFAHESLRIASAADERMHALEEVLKYYFIEVLGLEAESKCSYYPAKLLVEMERSPSVRALIKDYNFIKLGLGLSQLSESVEWIKKDTGRKGHPYVFTIPSDDDDLPFPKKRKPAEPMPAENLRDALGF